MDNQTKQGQSFSFAWKQSTETNDKGASNTGMIKKQTKNLIKTRTNILMSTYL